MQLNYKTKKLKKQLTDDRKLLKHYGHIAKKLRQRLRELRAADNLAIIKSIEILRLHEYKGARKGEWSIDIKNNWRLLFVIDNSEDKETTKDGIDLSAITIIKITSIEDPH